MLYYSDNNHCSRISTNIDVGVEYKKVIQNYFNRIPPDNFIKQYASKIINSKQVTTDLKEKICLCSNEIEELKKCVAQRDAIINEIRRSNSWWLTKPFRFLRRCTNRL